MSKKARRWKQTAVKYQRIVDRDTFFQAVAEAEGRFGAITSESLDPGESLVMLSLCTLAMLDGTKPSGGALQVEASEQEISLVSQRIITDAYYSPGPAFPYTKEEMALAWARGIEALAEGEE